MRDDYSYTYKAWAEAFTIFAKYAKSENELGDVAVEHDVIYGASIEGVSNEDVARLEKLGWHVDEKLECFYQFV